MSGSIMLKPERRIFNSVSSVLKIHLSKILRFSFDIDRVGDALSMKRGWLKSRGDDGTATRRMKGQPGKGELKVELY